MKAVLRTNEQHKFSQTNILPIVGEVTFDEEGLAGITIETKEDLDLLLSALPDLSVETTSINYELTQEDLDNYPELTEDGLKVGDTVHFKPLAKEEVSQINIESQVQANTIGKASDELNDIGSAKEADILKGDVIVTGTLVTDATDAGKGEGTQIKTDETAEILKNDAAISNAELLSLLESKTVPQLKELASTSGFPTEEWDKLNKAPLIEYLKGKLSTAA